MTQPPLQPRFGALQLLALTETKTTFEREETSDHGWDSGKYDGVAHGNWENCVRSHSAYSEGEWGIIVLCTIFLVSSSINVSIFLSTWTDTFWTDLVFPEIVYMKPLEECPAHKRYYKKVGYGYFSRKSLYPPSWCFSPLPGPLPRLEHNRNLMEKSPEAERSQLL